ncbi:hypothetical protein [Streptomyces sp. NPDC058092]|uniref:hypothetical protein n=1 Tax=Streptomyces sp. NPDC058092 TaxID=3346336 RepID=UPI0036EF1156
MVRETTEAFVGAVTGSLAAPRGLLLGRHDDDRRFQCTGHTTTLACTAGALLAPARRGFPGRVGRSPPGAAAEGR